MSDITYTAQGNFDRNGKTRINVCIPAEPKANAYLKEMYNMSKITPNGSINAIFCHFSDRSSVAMQHNSFDYRLNLDIYDLKNHPGAVDFDEFKDDALFIFFHNDKFDLSDRTSYFKNIEEFYDIVKNGGNQSHDGLQDLTNYASLNNPRKIGMSLVTRLNS